MIKFILAFFFGVGGWVGGCVRPRISIAKQTGKREGVAGKFQLCAYVLRMGFPFVRFLFFSFEFSGERRQVITSSPGEE